MTDVHELQLEKLNEMFKTTAEDASKLALKAIQDSAETSRRATIETVAQVSARQIGLRLEGGNLARELVPQRRVEVECVREQRQIGVALQDAMLVLCVRRFGSEHRAENVAHCDVNVRFLVFRRWQQQQRLEQFRVAVET